MITIICIRSSSRSITSARSSLSQHVLTGGRGRSAQAPARRRILSVHRTLALQPTDVTAADDNSQLAADTTPLHLQRIKYSYFPLSTILIQRRCQWGGAGGLLP